MVAAAVLANPILGKRPLVAGVTDSKKLNEAAGEGVVRIYKKVELDFCVLKVVSVF